MKLHVVGWVAAAALVSATPISAQLWFFPDYPVPPVAAGPSTFLAATYGRGLNDESGENDAFGAVVGRTGQVGVMGGLGFVDGFGEDTELTLGGAVGVSLLDDASAVDLTAQAGVGWLDVGDVTLLRFPIGVALQGMVEQASGAVVRPWLMPRLNISRFSNGDSDTETDFGVSAGVGFTSAGGFGLHGALDVLASDDAIWQFGVGAHYVLGR